MKKLLYSAFALVIIGVAVVSFSACGTTDLTDEFVYQAGITQMEMSSGSIKEMGELNSIYYKALGISEEYFTLKGSASECDQKVKNACATAEKTVSAKKWSFKFTYSVTNINTGKVVYEYKNN